MDGASSRTQSQSSSGHSDSPRPGQPEGDFTLPHYGVQQIPQTYKELAEPWIKVSPGGDRFEKVLGDVKRAERCSV